MLRLVSLELGAGGGLVGLAVAIGCNVSTTLHITDQDEMFSLMEKNIALNNLSSRVSASIYDWGQPTPAGLPQYPDVILAADCVYFEPAFPLLQQTLKDIIGPETVCYFCFKRRRRADLTFMKKVGKVFEVREVDDDPDRETWEKERLFLYVDVGSCWSGFGADALQIPDNAQEGEGLRCRSRNCHQSSTPPREEIDLEVYRAGLQHVKTCTTFPSPVVVGIPFASCVLNRVCGN